jgi:two-component system sensor histidine kinase PilS (NtrC family)
VDVPLPAAAAVRPPDRDEKKLLWLTFVRVAIITVLLGTTIAVNFLSGPAALPATLYALVAVVYVLTLVYVTLLLKRVRYAIQAAVQVVGDVAVYTALIYLTGGTEGAFPFIYSLAVINAAILFYRRGALLTAGACTAAFAALTALEATRILPPFEGGLSPAAEPTVLGAVNTVFINGAAYFFVALLASYLAEQLRAAESELAQAKGGLEDLKMLSDSILRSIADGLCTVGLDGRLTTANDAAEEILGRRRTEIIGRPVPEIFPDLEADLATLPSQVRRWREVRIPRGGETAVLGLSTSALRDADGALRGWLLVFHDLTPLKAMEARVHRSERLAALGQLAANMAHEIRNPLASMSGSIELLSRDRSLSSDNRELMEIVLEEADRLNRLIADFLDYARPCEPQPIPVDLADLCEEALRMLQNAPPSGAQVRIETELRPAPIEADPGQLKQVLWNLLKNAIEAMPGGGTLTVGAASVPAGGAVLSVRDTGAGIEPADIGRIFDPFFTTKERGLGLGLATVHRIVDGHGGRIEVQSAPGQGTLFTVHLPARPGPESRAARAA